MKTMKLPGAVAVCLTLCALTGCSHDANSAGRPTSASASPGEGATSAAPTVATDEVAKLQAGVILDVTQWRATGAVTRTYTATNALSVTGGDSTHRVYALCEAIFDNHTYAVAILRGAESTPATGEVAAGHYVGAGTKAGDRQCIKTFKRLHVRTTDK